MNVGLIVSPEDTESLRELARFAARPENYYYPGVTPIPGDLPEHTRRIFTYRVVLSITVYDGERFRHLSLSGIGCDTIRVAPSVVFTLATMCGFTGAEQLGLASVSAGTDWIIGCMDLFGAETRHGELPHIVTVAQTLSPEEQPT